jgi:hypothetical protein
MARFKCVCTPTGKTQQGYKIAENRTGEPCPFHDPKPHEFKQRAKQSPYDPPQCEHCFAWDYNPIHQEGPAR